MRALLRVRGPALAGARRARDAVGAAAGGGGARGPGGGGGLRGLLLRHVHQELQLLPRGPRGAQPPPADAEAKGVCVCVTVCVCVCVGGVVGVGRTGADETGVGRGQVMVVGGKAHVVRARQPVEDIWKNEVPLPADAA